MKSFPIVPVLVKPTWLVDVEGAGKERRDELAAVAEEVVYVPGRSTVARLEPLRGVRIDTPAEHFWISFRVFSEEGARVACLLKSSRPVCTVKVCRRLTGID